MSGSRKAFSCLRRLAPVVRTDALRALAGCSGHPSGGPQAGVARPLLFTASFASAAAQPAPAIDVASLNPRVTEAQYAVRGAIVARAAEIEAELKQGVPYPFSKILYCNIGNPQQLGAAPITFFRQVLALCDHPELLSHPSVGDMFPADAIARARTYLDAIPGGTGAYSASNGTAICRQHVAEGIGRRDGIPCDPDSLFLTDGASTGVHIMMRTLLRGPSDGIMVPIPQYPLYSAAITLYGGTLVPCYLDEASGWSMEVAELERALAAARAAGTHVRAVVVINPGNPTGQCMSEEGLREVVRLAKREGLLLLADEVYQENVYAAGREFHSLRKVVAGMGPEYADTPLISFHSISKGYYGECGRRGGYMEIAGLDPEVKAQLLKLASISLCPNINGQICTAMVMNPPQPGEESYELYDREKSQALASLKRRAKMIHEGLNKLEGVSCQEPEGALYAFPRIQLPEKAMEEAAAAGQCADFQYCMALLEATGIVAVPGSGFQQEPGTLHFRCTILPPEEDIAAVVERLSAFHVVYLARFA